jgi:hypothetical protein
MPKIPDSEGHDSPSESPEFERVARARVRRHPRQLARRLLKADKRRLPGCCGGARLRRGVRPAAGGGRVGDAVCVNGRHDGGAQRL